MVSRPNARAPLLCERLRGGGSRLFARIDPEFGGKLTRAAAQRFGHATILGHLRKQRPGFGLATCLHLGNPDQLARAAKPGIARHGQRLEPVDNLLRRQLVKPDRHFAHGGEIAIGLRHFGIGGDGGKDLCCIVGLFLVERDTAFDQLGRSGIARPAGRGDLAEAGLGRFPTTGFDLIERDGKGLALLSGFGSNMVGPGHPSGQPGQPQHDHGTDGHAIAADQAERIIPAQGIIDFTQEHLFLCRATFGIAFGSGRRVLWNQGQG